MSVSVVVVMYTIPTLTRRAVGLGSIIHSSVLYDSRLRLFRHSLSSWRMEEPGDWNLWRRMRIAGVRMAFLDMVVTRHYAERQEIAKAPTSTQLPETGAGLT